MSTRAGLWISPWMVWSLSYLVWSPRHSTMLGLVVGLPLPLAREGMGCVAFGRGRTRTSHVFPFADGTCFSCLVQPFISPLPFFPRVSLSSCIGKGSAQGDVSDLPLAQLQPTPTPPPPPLVPSNLTLWLSTSHEGGGEGMLQPPSWGPSPAASRGMGTTRGSVCERGEGGDLKRRAQVWCVSPPWLDARGWPS